MFVYNSVMVVERLSILCRNYLTFEYFQSEDEMEFGVVIAILNLLDKSVPFLQSSHSLSNRETVADQRNRLIKK